MFKTVHLTSVHYAFDTRIFYKECSTLVQAGYQVVLVVPHDNDEAIEGVQIRAVPKPRSRGERMTRTTWQLYRIAIQENSDIYHIHDPELLMLGQFLRLTGKRVVYDMHENLPMDVTTKTWIHPMLRPLFGIIFRFFQRVLLFRMPIIFAETSYSKYFQNKRKHVTVLNFPLAQNLLPLEASKYSVPTVCYIGAVCPQRGSLVTLKALQRLKTDGLDVHWECIGQVEDEGKLELEKAANEIGFNRIRLRGRMKLVECWKIMALCHVGLAVLQPEPNHLESYPTKVFEYMALGMPVIISNFRLYREVVQASACGICVNPENPEEIAYAIRWLLDHPHEAAAMGKNGQAAVIEKYSWDKEGQKLLAFYKDLLSVVSQR